MDTLKIPVKEQLDTLDPYEINWNEACPNVNENF